MAYQRVATANPVPRDAVMSLVIPWTELNHSADFIGTTMAALRWGCVMKVDLVFRSGGSRPHNTAYVHFSGWNATGPAMKAREALESGLELRVNYSNTHYWKVRQSRYVYRPQAPVPPAFTGPTWSVTKPVQLCHPDEDARAADEAFQSDLAYHQWLNGPATPPDMPVLEEDLESV